MDLDIIFLDFINFLKKPKLIELQHNSIRLKIKTMLNLLFLMFVSVYLMAILSKVILFLIDSKLSYIINVKQKLKWNKYSVLENVSYILFIGPFIEEIISRLFLNLKKANIQVSLLFLIILFLKFINLKFNINLLLYLTIILLCISLTFIIKQRLITYLGLKYYGFIFYFSCLTFSMLHFNNFTDVLPKSYFWLLPILVLPQLAMGMFFGYARVRLGFFWGISMHACMNLPAVLIYLNSKLL
ncbi:hypothetical protein Q361_11513 [Flavobacterium croceum DSM 17960]|uniref:CAAX prenyl protease-like protein n=1 Tax=Flavobacterium croceum DSM 17960 TaxID=1121886 RepID=A0A2S4N5K0_9FLAO|nr:hypothetical protein Q361_11513 [Flavobacterium croceum DSM 17960]